MGPLGVELSALFPSWIGCVASLFTSLYFCSHIFSVAMARVQSVAFWASGSLAVYDAVMYGTGAANHGGAEMERMKDPGFRSIVFGTTLSLIAFIGSLASIFAGWGGVGIIFSVILALVIVSLTFLVFRPIMIPNWRGVSLLTGIGQAGLIDIEDRDYEEKPLPPAGYYRQAKHEIALTGITLITTFRLHRELLLERLEANIEIYALLIDPNSKDIHRINENEERRDMTDIRNEIRDALAIMKSAGFLEYYKKHMFHVKFFQERPPFIGVMIDGDIARASPWTQGAQIRVQPFRMYKSVHKGIVLQFKYEKKGYQSTGKGRDLGGFASFAEDPRKQWSKAKENESYLEHPESIIWTTGQ